MSKKLKFVWIDDLPAREKSAQTMENKLNISIVFKCVKGKNLSEELVKIRQEPQPDLVILDHKLEEVESGVFKVGSTVAAFLRESWPTCPIVGITGANILLDVNFQQRESYEEIFSATGLIQHYGSILAIAKSFRYLKDNLPRSLDDLMDMMKVPTSERAKIKTIFPTDLRDNIADPTVMADISRWLRRIFLERPGFVYDKLWTATLLGLSIRGFDKVSDSFKSAQYSGIFADDSAPKWWKSKVLLLLNKLTDSPGFPWEKGRNIVDNFRKTDFSVCYQSGEDYPQTVAYVDSTMNSERHPMKIKNTNPHPGFEDLLYFEEMRMMKPA